MMKKLTHKPAYFLNLTILFIPLFFYQCSKDENIHESRPKHWAQPLVLEGVPNLHIISKNLYRSAQPSGLGMKNLKSLGIKSIINLRAFHSDRDEIGETDLKYYFIKINTWKPKEIQVIKFIKLISRQDNWPVLFHCQHGADRTGIMSAVIRILINGWSKSDALEEMTRGGYGFHHIWKNLISFINNLDVDQLNEKLKMTSFKAVNR